MVGGDSCVIWHSMFKGALHQRRSWSWFGWT